MCVCFFTWNVHFWSGKPSVDHDDGRRRQRAPRRSLPAPRPHRLPLHTSSRPCAQIYFQNAKLTGADFKDAKIKPSDGDVFDTTGAKWTNAAIEATGEGGEVIFQLEGAEPCLSTPGWCCKPGHPLHNQAGYC